MRISDWSSDVCSSDLGSRIDGFRCALPILRTLRACEHRRMTDDRIIAADATREDEAIEASIRPKRLDEYLGQRPVREQLAISTEAAKRRHESPDTVLNFDPPGLGKTTLSHAIPKNGRAESRDRVVTTGFM